MDMTTPLPPEIQQLIDDKISECSFGIAVLQNGNTINIRKDFIRLTEMWGDYTIYREMKMDELNGFMRETKGLFCNGEMFIRFSDILALVSGEETESNNKKGIDQRDYAGVVDSALNIFSGEDFDDEETS